MLWEFDLYSIWGTDLVAMFDLVYQPGILGLFYGQIRELVFGSRMWVKGADTRKLSSFWVYKAPHFPHSGMTFY